MAATDAERQPLVHKAKLRNRWCNCWHRSYIILVVVLFERIGSVALRANLVQFLEYHGFLGWSTTQATLAALLSTKFGMCGAVFSGILADTWFGRYAVLLVSILLQGIGASLLMAATIKEKSVDVDDNFQDTFQGLVITGLVLFGVGIAGSYGTEIPLGVDQYESQQQQQAGDFFPHFYWMVNAGSIIGQSAVSVLQVNRHIIGYAVPPACYLVSFLVLLVSRKVLLSQEEFEGAQNIGISWKICINAIQVRRKSGKKAPVHRMEGASVSSAWGSDVTAPWIRYADRANGGSYSYNEVAKAQNLVAIISMIAGAMFYQVTLDQTTTSFTSQGNLMQLPIERDHQHVNATIIPPAAFAGFNGLAILIAIPLFYGVVYPLWERCGHGPLSATKRMYIGMLIAILSIVAALVVEVERRREGKWDFLNTTDRLSPNISLCVSSVSIFYQVPQYMLSGVAEVLVALSLLELAYNKSPIDMKSTCIGLAYVSNGVAAMISIGILSLAQKYRPSLYFVNCSRGNVHYFFAVLAGVVTLGILLFHAAARRFRPARLHSVSPVPGARPASTAQTAVETRGVSLQRSAFT